MDAQPLDAQPLSVVYGDELRCTTLTRVIPMELPATDTCECPGWMGDGLVCTHEVWTNYVSNRQLVRTRGELKSLPNSFWPVGVTNAHYSPSSIAKQPNL